MSIASKQTLLDQIDSGKIETDKLKVLNSVIKHGKGTYKEIASRIKINENIAQKRASDLFNDGYLYEDSTLTTSKGHYTVYEFEPNEELRKKRAENIRYEKYVKWSKKGIDFQDLIDKYGINFNVSYE